MIKNAETSDEWRYYSIAWWDNHYISMLTILIILIDTMAGIFLLGYAMIIYFLFQHQDPCFILNQQF